jgi:hypothetical protein
VADKDWRATFEYIETASGRVFDMTFCVREHTSVPGASSLAAGTVAADLRDWLKVEAKALTMNTVKLQRIHVNRGGPFGPDEGEDQESGEVVISEACTAASAGGISLPHGLCARVTVYTALASRRGRGRFHAPWPDSAAALAAPDRFLTTNAYMVNLTTFANDLLGGHNVTHDTIDHHYSLRVHSRRDALTRDAASVSVRDGVSYLRSRLTAP